MGIRTFRDDEILAPLLDALPKRSKVIRRALYDYFFKGKDIAMVEDENVYIEAIKEVEVKIESVNEIKFDMFED